MDNEPLRSEPRTQAHAGASCGSPCRPPFIEQATARLIEDFHPKALLAVGHAADQLAAALCERGVEAYGIVGFEDTPGESRLVEDLCSRVDRILFSPAPDGSEDTAERWMEQFAGLGFYREFSYDARYLSPRAVSLCRTTLEPAQLVEQYERCIRKIGKPPAHQGVLPHGQNEQAELLIQAKQDEILSLTRQIHERDARIAEIYRSRGYRFLAKCYRMRDVLLPKGSRRFLCAKVLLRAPQYLKKGYPLKYVAFAARNGLRAANRRVRTVVLGELPALRAQASASGGLLRSVRNRPAPPRHSESVDVIICVHNAYEYVKKCIASVFEFTSEPFNILLVDDGSEAQTRDYLADLEAICPNVRRIRNETGNGYTIAANMGLRASKADYCVLLNSDTVVTQGWLDKMIACAKSNPKIGIVGPLSNTASWQSIPEVFGADGDWCHNELPAHCSIESYAKAVEDDSARLYVDVPLLNGFCLMITRRTIDRIGYLDEENFGRGFGEEDDYNLRAYSAGIRLAIADDTYIFHAQSKSYSDEKRLELCRTSGQKVLAKHGEALLAGAVRWMRESYILEGIRARSKRMLERETLLQQAKERWEGRRVLFILPIAAAGGGGNVIIQEARVLLSAGIDVCLFNWAHLQAQFESAYPDLDVPVLYGETGSDFRRMALAFDVVCATIHSTVQLCQFPQSAKSPAVVYYIQDYEPYFYEKAHKEHYAAAASYTLIPNMIRVTKTTWTADEVEARHGVDCVVLGPSVDIDLFRPRRHFGGQDVVRVCAMVRPDTPRRAAGLTMSVLRSAAKRYGKRIEISLFGSDPTLSAADNAFFQSVPTDFPYRQFGMLTPEQMARLLCSQDIFADFSSFQAMGLTAMEAMASGCAVIVPQNGGAVEFAVDGGNALVVDTSGEQACFAALCRLIDDDTLRDRLSRQAINDMCAYPPEKCAYRFLEAALGAKEGEK